MADKFERPFYGRGTAAGAKGNSEQARHSSQEAAKDVTESLGRRHRQMVEAWAHYGAQGAIPEEIANDLELPVHIVRPRAGELVKRGLLFELDRRPGGMGCRVTAYSVVQPEREAV